MTDSYKVRTSQLPNFRDENMKRNEEQENFPPCSPLAGSLYIPPSLITREYQTSRQILSRWKAEGMMLESSRYKYEKYWYNIEKIL